MKHVTGQRKRKRWLTPLALCLAVSLAMSPAGLSAVRAEENNTEEFSSRKEAFWTAWTKLWDAASYWDYNDAYDKKTDLYWKAKEKWQDSREKEELKDGHNEARESLTDCRKAVRESMTDLKKAYEKIITAYKDLSTAYEAFTEQEKNAVANEKENKSFKDLVEGLTLIDGDENDPEEDPGVEKMYRLRLLDYEQWNYWDLEVQYMDAWDDYNSARDALEEGGTMQDLENARALVKEVYGSLTETYNALSDEAKEEGIEDAYQNWPQDFAKWSYWDNEFQYQKACQSYGSACEALWGNDEKDITGAMKEYDEAMNNNGDVDAALKKVQECVSGVKDAKALIDKFYDAMEEVYGKIPDGKKDDLEESHQNEIKRKEILDLDHSESLSSLNIWEYNFSNVDFGKAWDLFFKVTNDFQGNEQEDIPGLYPTYMTALESGAEKLDALYEEVLAARAAVEEAYETLTVKYQAETAAYEALTEDDRKALYGDTTAEAMHKANEESYTGYGTETYKLIHECEIPAPPQIEDILDADYSAATKEEVNKAVKDLENLVATADPGSYDAVDETTMEKVDKLETAYARENNITLAASAIADDVKDFGSDAAPQVVGALMALQPAAETTIKLAVKSPAAKPEESLKNAVAVDIDLVDGNGQSLTMNVVLKFPVTITISVPTALKNATKIGIKHGDETISPKMANGMLIFAVTHFSDFVFYDAGSSTDTPGTTDKPGSGNDVSGNDPGSTDTPVTPDEPGNSGTSNSSASAIDYYGNFVQSTEQAIAAAEKDSTVKIVTTGSITLTSSVLKTLINNPTVSLYLEYTYNGQDYKVLIPAGKAFVVEGIEYYGPLYLYSLFPYDGREVNANTLEYTIVKGDTLAKIAKKNNTTVSELVKLNRIKNPNRIRAGQKIVLPAK